MMLKYGCLLFLLCSMTFCLRAGERKYRVMFYNVENLFDTADDPVTDDEEFTPGSRKKWTEARYAAKLRDIASVVKMAGGGRLPEFVGLAEVENRRVVEDLIRTESLAGGRYGIIHRDSPDGRGIDVAFLYRKDQFRILKSSFFPVHFPEDTTIRTRDILYTSGVAGKDTLHFFVCHFPSMYGGERESEWKRVRAASVVRARVDSIRVLHPRAAIIIMGDFNGKAATEAQKKLGVSGSDAVVNAAGLYNTGYYLLNEKSRGSYRYRGNWQTLDHILVSGALLDKKPGLKSDRHLTVFSAPFMLEKDVKYQGEKPRPTYRGPIYVGGCSDHLPVVIDLH